MGDTTSAEGSSWRLMRTRDGKLLDEVPAAPAFLAPPVDGAGPDVATSASGGLYRREGGSDYAWSARAAPSPSTRARRWWTSAPCRSPATSPWIGLDSGAPIDRPLPTGDAGINWVGSAGTSGRFLIGWRSGRLPYGGDLVLYDLVKGRVVETGVDVGVGPVAGTPDGRYVAVEAQTNIHIYDAEQDRWVAVHRTGDASASLLFVPNGGG